MIKIIDNTDWRILSIVFLLNFFILNYRYFYVLKSGNIYILWTWYRMDRSSFFLEKNTRNGYVLKRNYNYGVIYDINIINNIY